MADTMVTICNSAACNVNSRINVSGVGAVTQYGNELMAGQSVTMDLTQANCDQYAGKEFIVQVDAIGGTSNNSSGNALYVQGAAYRFNVEGSVDNIQVDGPVT